MPNNSPQQNIKGPPKFLEDAVNAVNAKEFDKAIEILKKGMDCDRYIAYSGLGEVYNAKGNYEESIKWLEKAYDYNPDEINLLERIAGVLAKLNREDEALKILSKSLKRQTNTHNIRLIADLMHKKGKGQAAVEILEQMIKAHPKVIELVFELGLLTDRMLDEAKAEQCYKTVIRSIPHAYTYDRFGLLCLKQERMTEAVTYLRKAMELRPDDNNIRNDLATVLMKAGELQEGSKLLQKSIEVNPLNVSLQSSFLYHLHLLPGVELQTIFDAHRNWGQKHAPVSLAKFSHTNTPDPNRKLRIGYISPDFRSHPVAQLVDKLLEFHNHNEFEFYGYGNTDIPDQITARMQKLFDHYQHIYGLNDDLVAGMIHHDKIDILVDLAGHSLNHRLLVLARKPAPIQASFYGYCDTTGMTQVDYIITDELLNPPESRKYYTEDFAYLPSGICFFNCRVEVDSSPLPFFKNGHITFGAFTNCLRFNDELFRTWAEILKSVPNSKLMLGFAGGDDETIRSKYLKQFENLNVPPGRVETSGKKTYKKYLEQYSQVDITLDTFPENGGTTTSESLWMGSPVISKYMQNQNGRVGLSLLKRIGLGDLAVPTADEYVKKAIELAKNPEKLAILRSSLRTTMTNSPLCDPKRYTLEIEAAFRKMWHTWCSKRISN
jgi:predicted O-linked N-acetylglucosamine transferase (SPINDLY family)